MLVYVLGWVALLLVALVVAFDSPTVVVTVVLMGLALGALWRGSRTAWVLLLLLEVSLLVSAPFTATPWWAIPVSILALGLLVASPTRHHIARA